MKKANRFRTGFRKRGCLTCSDRDLARRDFLRVGSLGFLGLSLSQVLELESLRAASGKRVAGKAEACILLWLGGGPSQMDTWDPKSNSGFKAIATNVDGVQISELLPKTARHMDKLSIVRTMHTEENNHPQGHIYALTGHRPNAAMKFPSFPSIIAKELGARGEVPPHILCPGWDSADAKRYNDLFKSAFLGPRFDPMVLADRGEAGIQVSDLALPQSFPVGSLENRRTFLDIVDRTYREKVEAAEFSKMDGFREKALQMILSPKVREAFDLSGESDKTKEAYGDHKFGQSVLLARRLIEAGSRFVTANGYSHNVWDTHGDNDVSHRDKLVPPLDRALSALLEDLEQRGLLETTVVIAMGEFGRTPHLNPGYGRDHWPECWSLALGGGGIRGGQIVGVSDKTGGYVVERRVTMGDLHATIYKALGIDWHKELMSPIGRPVKIANSIDDVTGVPLQELV